MYVSSLHFYWYGSPRDLHSFPTRRSSDLLLTGQLVQYGRHRQRRSYARISEVLELPNLIEIQTASYNWFLEEGLKEDRKSTRLNSSHVAISYAVFCLKKKKKHS